MSKPDTLTAVSSNDGLGLVEEIAHRMAWRYKKSSDPHHSDTYTFNRHCLLSFAAKLLTAERSKTLHDSARWVDEEVGHAVQDGWSIEAVQALMATRDMLKAHADMHQTTIPGAYCLDDKDLSHL